MGICDALGNYVGRFPPFWSPLFGQECTRDAKYLDQWQLTAAFVWLERREGEFDSLLTQSKFSRNSASPMTNKVFFGEASFHHQYAQRPMLRLQRI